MTTFTQTTDQTALVNAMLASAAGTDTSGIVIDPTSVTLSAAASATGTYDGSLTPLGIGSGIIMTSGTMPGTSNTLTYFGQDNGLAGDPTLDAVVNTVFNTVSYDAAKLSFSFQVTDPNATSISFDIVFGSDEFPEWVDQFVDIAVVMVNGVNYALFNHDPLAPLTVTSPNLAANYFLDNSGNALPIEYDGVSMVLKIVAPIQPGMNTIEIGIADTGDHIYDSGIIISNLAAGTIPGSGVVVPDQSCTDGNDNFVYTDKSDYIDAKAGNDTIDGKGGDDIIVGGDGDDSLTGGSGNDTIAGGIGIDTAVYSGNQADYSVIQLGDGKYQVTDLSSPFNEGSDILDGIESLQFLDVASTPIDGATTPSEGGIPSGTVFGTADDDDITPKATDVINTTNFDDVVDALAGNDTVDGGLGNDIITGGAGDDELNGNLGIDTAVYSGNFADYEILLAVAGSDGTPEKWTINGQDGFDRLESIEFVQFADLTYNLAAGFALNSDIKSLTDWDKSGNAVAEHAALGSTVGITARGIDLDVTDTITYKLVNPTGEFEIDPVSGIVTVSGDIAYADGATRTITVNAESSDGSSITTDFLIAVTPDTGPVNQAPVALDSGFSLPEDGALIGAVTATDTENDALAYTLVGGAPAGLLFNSDGTFSYTPPADFNGTITFQYIASDGALDSNVGTVTLDVTAVGDVAVISGESSGDRDVREDVDAAASGLLTIVDPDSGEAAFAAASGQAVYGTYSIGAGGAWSYVLDNANAAVQSLSEGASLNDSFVVHSIDGTAAATIVIAIAGTNDAPIVSGAVTAVATEGGASVAVDALANAADIDIGAVLSVVDLPATLPAGVTYDAATHQFRLDPADPAYQSLAAGQQANITVAYGVSDGAAVAPASVVFSIIGTDPQGVTIIGTSQNNTISTIKTVAGQPKATDYADVIYGMAGNDTINAGGGADTIYGGTGNDVIHVDNPLDQVIELAGEGSDTVIASLSFALAANIENLTLAGSGNFDGKGNELANRLTGNAGDNILDGGAGADRLAGGAGNDSYVVDSAGDIVVESSGQGTDLVMASINYTLGKYVENLTLTGVADISGSGNTLANIINGNAGHNIINGGGGADTLIGGDGNDTYIVDNIGDQVIEAAGQGTDEVRSSLNWLLNDHVENLILTGSRNISGHGNELDNLIIGNSGANLLNGHGGADHLIGGGGKDIFAFSSADDIGNHPGISSDDILDFAAGDHIDLSALDADINSIGSNDAFQSIGGAAFSHVAGQLRFAVDTSLTDPVTGRTGYLVEGDMNGDGQADFSLVVHTAKVLTNSDFVL
jgi:VCBS repeat-containing protein